MKKNIFNILIISVLSVFLFVSCSKNTSITPTLQTCYLSSVTNVKGNVLQRFTYDANDRLISEVNDSTGVSLAFTYNAQNTVDKITVANKVGTKVYTFIIAFTYDGTGKANKAITTFNGNVYQTNVFTYTNNQLMQIISTDALNNIESVRFEYSGENISKVYAKFDNDKEYLYYEITKFDAMKLNLPEAYKALAVGLAGLADDFYLLNKNNALSEKYYEEDGSIYHTTENIYEYNSTSQPTKLTGSYNENSVKITMVNNYQYNCK